MNPKPPPSPQVRRRSTNSSHAHCHLRRTCRHRSCNMGLACRAVAIVRNQCGIHSRYLHLAERSNRLRARDRHASDAPHFCRASFCPVDRSLLTGRCIASSAASPLRRKHGIGLYIRSSHWPNLNTRIAPTRFPVGFCYRRSLDPRFSHSRGRPRRAFHPAASVVEDRPAGSVQRITLRRS